MACSGAWDWAPYGTTFTAQQDHTFSKGIVRSIYLVPVQTAAIAHVVPKVTYTGGYESSPLVGRSAAPFNVTVDVVLSSPSGGTGVLSLTGSWAAASPVTQSATLVAGENVISVTLPQATNINLWWPAGMGAAQTQALYDIAVSFTPSGAPAAAAATGARRVGFRVLHLVTVDDSNPSAYAGQNGSGNFTMRFKVNGADWYPRGANMIPMEEMEGRQTAEAYGALLHSAVAAGHSMLRVWGGGVYLPQVFYDTADELGVTLYHDLMYGTPWFGGQGGKPTATATQTAEIIHSVRRLASHPCILIWNGGNEDLGRWDDVIVDFLMPVLTSVDATRPVWPTSPSYGWASGVDRLTGLPNGQPWVLPPTTGPTIETHGPYQHGAGYKTVNGDGNLDLFPSNMPPGLSPATTGYGADQRGVFASEFGCSVFSSFESMAPTLSPQHWSARSAPMTQRNYPTDNIVYVYFGQQAAAALNNSGTYAFQMATYLATLGSALQQKSDIEARRSGNAWGTLTWQLGEIWPTGGWGSLEYGTVGWTPGQVLGGRWKPLHHFMASHLYNNQVLVCGSDARCIVKNDDPIYAWSGTWSTSFLRVTNGQIFPLASGAVALPRGANAAQWTCADGKGSPANGCTPYSTLLSAAGCAANASDCVLMAQLTGSDGTVADYHIVQLVSPANMTIPRATVDAAVSPVANVDGSVNVTVTVTGGSALYVTLTTLEQGYFSDNAFVVASGPRDVGIVTVRLLPIPGAGLIDPQRLASTLRVDHLGLYLPVGQAAGEGAPEA